MKNQYVILTGSKNNAGDFLIKYRAKQLFTLLRKDREIIDFNAWEDFDAEKLKTINESKALILLGGPSLVKGMRRIYKMARDINAIKVPIITMGIGWKSIRGNWEDTYQYPLGEADIDLLNIIESSGYFSSVRDYHSLNAIKFKGYNNFLMTGCPAYYDVNFIGKETKHRVIEKVAFSLGVSFVQSSSMQNLMKDNILKLKEKFEDKIFEVIFHHGLNKEQFLATHGASKKHHRKHNEFSKWLESQNILYKDISGSAESLIEYYKTVDLHIGYRVHAHIFMNSISRYSILISEDGRAKAVKNVIGGLVLDGYMYFKQGIISKIGNRLFDNYDRYSANEYLSQEILDVMEYEESNGFLRMRNTRNAIDNNFSVMKKFIQLLP